MYGEVLVIFDEFCIHLPKNDENHQEVWGFKLNNSKDWNFSDQMMIPFRHGPWPSIDVRDWLRGGVSVGITSQVSGGSLDLPLENAEIPLADG